MEKKCKNCASWQRDGADGICRRKAPQSIPIAVTKETKEITLAWPRTNPEEWCMQFVEWISEESKA